MAIRQELRTFLVCAGCKAEHGPPAGHSSAVEARAAAYADGWRFLPRVRASGAVSMETDDVCPYCIEGWTPRSAKNSWGGRK